MVEMNYLKSLPLILVLSFILLTGLSPVVGSAQTNSDATARYPLSLCNYTMPETTYQNLGLNFNYHFYDDPDLDDEDNINRGSATGNYAYILSNPNYSLNLSSQANVSLSEGALNYSATGSSRYNFYPTPNDFFAFGGLRLDLSENFSEIAAVKASTGAGFGRFKNVTPLVKSSLINKMLVDRGVISEGLSQDTVQEIAREIGGIVPGTGIENLVNEIVSMVEADAVPEDEELGAIETLRIREIVEQRIRSRLCGWEIRSGLSYEVLDPQGAGRDVLLNAAARYARPFTPYSQLSLEADFTTTFEVTEGHTINGLANYTYRFSENVDAEFQYKYLYRQGATDSFYQQTLSATADLELHSDLGMTTTVGLRDNSNYEELEKEVTVGVSFNLI